MMTCACGPRGYGETATDAVASTIAVIPSQATGFHRSPGSLPYGASSNNNVGSR